MSHVTNFFGLLEQLQSADITVHQNRCAVVRNRNATCMKCAEVCTSGCISYDDNELVIAPEKCIGCGTCATICPTCALEAHRPDDAELLQSCLSACAQADGEVIIACEQLLSAAEGLYDPEKVVGAACLGRVEESLLVSLAAQDAAHVSLVRAKCASCAHAVGHDTAELVCATANTLLETWNSPLRASIVDKLPSLARLAQDKGYDAGRRGFFATMKGEAKNAAVTTADYAVKDALGVEEQQAPKYVKVTKDGTLPHFIPHRRERLLDALAALGEPQDVMIDTRLWGHVVIEADECSSCQMCATFCPTGAIAKFKEEDGTFGVEHRPSACVKCRCCTDICPEDALWLSDEVFAVDLLSNAVERYEMKPLKNPPGNPHQIYRSMKDLIGIDQVYER
ncbi:4Fe-4S binding protein [Eggerthella sinensis]|uniref:4Fe-4S binding protein n=1 Tax=Eggerthella sinensis TaxID=242230 RepID=UPI001D095289|nr:4Fe-4S binding protein [Eggerthella sinensis]MCB7036160.1 4Fe-4S binding protein [Eggerthella sinensis]